MSARAVAWLLASVLGLHVLTAVYLEMLGPAHFHIAPDDHYHHHDHVERHHHHPHDGGVVTVEDPSTHQPSGAEDEMPSGWSGTALVALPAFDRALQLPETAGGPAARQDAFLQTRFPGRLERPPRINPA